VSGGRVFQRHSRHTGAALATWWIAYYVDGKERRESAHSAALEVAQRLLRGERHEGLRGEVLSERRALRRSVFDRYSLTLKAQTRATLERVTARAARAHATAIAATLEKRWPTVRGGQAHWTRVSLAALAKLGTGYGFESHYSRKCGGRKERLWDLIWCKCSPTTKEIVALPFVAESEWAKGGLDDDFAKLLFANAPLRLMIFGSSRSSSL
jgi:hypothetical protein